MPLHEFMTAHRDEILDACRARFSDAEHPERLVSYLAETLDDFVRLLQSEAGREHRAGVLVGMSPAMTRVRISIDQLSRRSRAPVLILGELGTGKRHCARALHAATYPEGEFFELDSAEHIEALDRRVASLRARASVELEAGLTVYVHELTQVPACVQSRLLKLLREHGLQFRVIASSSRALADATKDHTLPSQLVFCFPTTLKLAALRDRREDIAELCQHFAELASARNGSPTTTFSDAALERLAEHVWPGNLTELANVVSRLSDDFGAGPVQGTDLLELGERPSGVVFHLPPAGIDFCELERELLMQALAMADNNQTRAASLLGLTRDQIRYRMAKFEISTATGRSASHG